MAKMGRPPVEKKKTKSISVRFSDEEFKKMSQYANDHKMTITQLVQKGVEVVMSDHTTA